MARLREQAQRNMVKHGQAQMVKKRQFVTLENKHIGTNCLEKGVSQVRDKMETEGTKRHRKVTFMRPTKLQKRSREGQKRSRESSCNDLSRPLGAKMGP
jgi:uncharacterized FAD-dependent dehydrogenase